MIWSSSSVVLVALVATACTRVDATPIEIRVDSCSAAGAAMNLYVATLFVVDDGRQVPQNADCSFCVQGNCSVADELCVCGDDIPAQSRFVRSQMSGQRFADLDDSRSYCIRIVALEQPVTGACTCPPLGATDPATLRICVFSNIGVVNAAGAPLLVDKASCDATSAAFMACMRAGTTP